LEKLWVTTHLRLLKSQGEIIDELRKVRAELWRERPGDMKKIHFKWTAAVKIQFF
jgi:hypothetical protein